ncbi:MAG: hypothetical protein VW450_05550 [Chloroflexota bacterium]
MPQHASGRWLVGIGAAVVALALVSVLVSVLAGGRGPAALEPGSPEEAVQRYLLAIKERDYAAAYALLGPDLTEACTLSDFLANARYDTMQDFRVQLDESQIVDVTHANVWVRITQFYGNPPFDLSESTFTTTFLLERVAGAWVLAEAPWPGYGCGFRSVKPEPEPTSTPTPTPTTEPAA